MGKRGPRPTPTALLRLRGSPLATKRRAATEAKGPAGARDRPEWLDDDAKAVWDQLVPQLAAMQVLSRIDRNAVGRYCVLFTPCGSGGVKPTRSSRSAGRCTR
jgi:phage terminase small subunit